MQKYTGGGIYVFAGGFTHGSAPLFKPLFHLEGNNYGVSSFKLNYPNVPVYVGYKNWPIDDCSTFAHATDYIWANPPCAPWSVAGRVLLHGGDGWKSDPRIECWEQTFTACMKLVPKFFAIESVVGAFTRGREMVDGYAEQAVKNGYNVTHLLVDAQYLGLHQTRRRYFFVGHAPSFIVQVPNYEKHALTANEFLANVEELYPYDPADDSDRLSTEYLNLLPDLKQGERLRNAWERAHPPETWTKSKLGVKGRPSQFTGRIDGNKVMQAYTGHRFIHPTQHRLLSITEIRLAMGFGVEYQFAGKNSTLPSLMARGVSPTVASWLARQVSNSLDRNFYSGVPRVSILDLRTPPHVNGSQIMLPSFSSR